MLDHVTIRVDDISQSINFYDQALRPFGITRFSISRMRPLVTAPIGHSSGSVLRPVPQTGTHVAFTVEEREMVERFYEAARAAGARDNGAPGLRPHHHLDYYGAFILDPDGHNIEAVCHHPAG